MTEAICRRLDEYLDGELTTAAAEQFVRHLQQCPTCREAVQFDQITTQAAREIADRIEVPRELNDRTRRAIRQEQRRSLVGVCSLAAVLAGCVLYYSWSSLPGVSDQTPQAAHSEMRAGSHVDEDTQPATQPDTSARHAEVPQDPAPSATVRLRASDSQKHIVVARPSDNRNVTVVMMYRTFNERADAPSDRADLDAASDSN